MQKTELILQSQEALTSSVYRMRLTSRDPTAPLPGQFVNLALPGLFLRRPISVCDFDGHALTLVYRCVGKGTAYMTQAPNGSRFDALVSLGHGYDLARIPDGAVLVGGGVGIPPLVYLARALHEAGKACTAVLGFRNREDVFLADTFAELGINTVLVTEDGSLGKKGFVTDALPDSIPYVCACGPEGMLRALLRCTPSPAQLSLEERMGCGFGACMGCSLETRDGPRRVCKEGPVFPREVLLWN